MNKFNVTYIVRTSKQSSQQRDNANMIFPAGIYYVGDLSYMDDKDDVSWD